MASFKEEMKLREKKQQLLDVKESDVALEVFPSIDEKKVRMTIRMKQSNYDQLVKMAKESGLSISSFVNTVLIKYMRGNTDLLK